MKLLAANEITPDDRNQFFKLAATMMRGVIIDEIRALSAQKRDVELADTPTGDIADHHRQDQAEFLLKVERALTALEQTDERASQVFECRYVAGYSTKETAECLGLSERTVERSWQQAREFIADQLV